MDVVTLEREIAEHRESLAALNGRLNRLIAGIEALTAETRELLGEYQERKRQAGEALGAISRQFQSAQRAFHKVHELFADLEGIKSTHVNLSSAVNAFLGQGDSEEARRVLREFTKIRRSLQSTYRRIERCRKDAQVAETEEGAAGEISPQAQEPK
jgi:ABC-type transporter Mla subunit MlaD